MSSLPEVVRGPFCYRLPLGDDTAFRLAAILLAASERERIEQLELALAVDAPLAVWAILVAPDPKGPAVPLSAIAAWLAPRLARLLANCPGQNDVLALGSLRPAGSNGTGHPIRGLPESPAEIPPAASTDRNRQFLAGLRAAAGWLVEFGSPPPDRAAAEQALPSWLSRSLEQLGDLGQTDTPFQQAGSRESAAVGPWPALLSRLAEQTVRLAALEADFRNAVEQEKLAALKEFAYGAGHEINNPLANISARAQTLLKDEHDPDRRQKLAAINSQAFRAHEMIADLMLFAQPPQRQPTRVPLAELLAELESAWRRQASEQGTTLTVHLDDERLAAWADRSAIAVALRALVANAMEALGHGGTIEIAVMPDRLATDRASGESLDASAANSVTFDAAISNAVAIRVRDDGPGIDPSIRPRIFDPFFSGREAGRGLGFGLPKCWRIVTALGGRIDVDSQPSAGATFTIVLPSAGPTR